MFDEPGVAAHRRRLAARPPQRPVRRRGRRTGGRRRARRRQPAARRARRRIARRRRAGLGACHASAVRPLPDRDDFWIVPTWREIPAAARQVIRLDPGRAFGTGTHPTTRMCLRWIATQGAAGVVWPRALDYGCGSGVLAIAASRFGAREVDAVDIDPAAIETTRANALANGVAVRAGTPEDVAGPLPARRRQHPRRAAQAARAAAVGARRRRRRPRPAGILERQADELRAAYAPWLALERRRRGRRLDPARRQRVRTALAHGMIWR